MVPARACCRKTPPIISTRRTTRGTFSSPPRHLIHTIIRDIGGGTYVVRVFLGMEIVRVQRFGGRQTERLGQLTQGTRKEGHAIQEHQVLHHHAHYLQSVHDQFRFPFQ